MKYIWSITTGMITTFFALSFYFEEVPISIYILAVLLLVVVIISQIVFNKTKTKSIIFLPIIFMMGMAVVVFVKCIDFIVIDFCSITSLISFVSCLISAIIVRSIKKNLWFGVRTPFTMEYKAIWDKSNKFGSFITSGFLPPMFALIFWSRGFTRFLLSLILSFVLSIIIIIYDKIIGSKYHKEAKAKEAEELKIQEEIEQGYQRKKCD